MNKSTILLAGCFMTFLYSCYSYKEISGIPEIEKYEGRKHIHVLKANVDSNMVFFSEKMPGRLSENHIVGIHQIPLAGITADSIFYRPVKYKRIIDYVYKDGIKYHVFEEKNQIYMYDNTITVNIPYKEGNSVHLKVFRPGSTAALVGGTSAGLGFIFALLLLNMTFDGGLGGI